MAIRDGRLDVKPLISHRFAIDDVEGAYALVGGAGPSLAFCSTIPKAKSRHWRYGGRRFPSPVSPASWLLYEPP